MDERVKDTLAEALHLSDPAERRAYLDCSCAGNEALRAEVESLLAASEEAGDFFDGRILPHNLAAQGVFKVSERIASALVSRIRPNNG